jgi:hypothetical protein
MEGRKPSLRGMVFMSKALYLPTPSKNPTPVLIKKPEAQEMGSSHAQISRIVHDLKNCMSVLLLVISSLKENTDQSTIAVSRRKAIEDAVAEMNHLVNEMAGLVERSDKTN